MAKTAVNSLESMYPTVTEYVRNLLNPNTLEGKDFFDAVQLSIAKEKEFEKYIERLFIVMLREDEKKEQEFKLKQQEIAIKEAEHWEYLDALPKETTIETSSGLKTIEELKKDLASLDKQYDELSKEQNLFYEKWQKERKENALLSWKDFKTDLEAAGLQLTTPDGQVIQLTEAKMQQLAQAQSDISKHVFEYRPDLLEIYNQLKTQEERDQMLTVMQSKSNLSSGMKVARYTGGDENASLLEGKIVALQYQKMDSLHQQTSSFKNKHEAFYSLLADTIMKDFGLTRDKTKNILEDVKHQARVAWKSHPKTLESRDENVRDNIAEQLITKLMSRYQNELTGSEQTKQALKQAFLSVLEKERPTLSLTAANTPRDMLRMIQDREFSLKKTEITTVKSKTLEHMINQTQQYRQEVQSKPGR
ncbi:MAG: hypothetical protein A3F11_00895 [Gammaproteobacteria bacterium RIFCSPHIGHO2_12_FULL_37_14]|nr:MAG: hypothetical protein A3F11_00895 [Gammaproteobacteria bacterium RIFCSPHIGHO2_12_FULL_37_14]